VSWAPWSKAEEASLAGYARPEAIQLLPALDRTGRRPALVRAIYDAIAATGIRYVPEAYLPEAERQVIRSPDEVVGREGTCLDLALVVAGVCLGYELLPVLVVFDDHAMVAVSTRFGRREQGDAGRGAELDWSRQGKGRIAERGALQDRVDDGDYLAVECTGLARLDAAIAGPEGRGRVGGLLSFDEACRAGAEQFDERTFRFALDVAALQDQWRVRTPEPVGARADYRAEIEPLLDYYVERPLVGREAELERLMRFASQEAPGSLVVEGEAMFGKSALLAHLVRRADAGRWAAGAVPDIAFFFVREEQKRNTATAFLAAVNAQLLGLLRSSEGVAGGADLQRDQLFRLWKQAAAMAGPYRPLLLLVDGLDEMAASDTMTILDALPPASKPYVHILASSRPGVLPVLFPPHPLAAAELLHLGRLDEPAVADLLVGNGVDGARAAAMAGRVRSMTRGEPLFASVVAGDVAAGGEDRLAELEAEGVTGMGEYFRSDVAELKQRLETQVTGDVLGLLAAAEGGMTFQELAAVQALATGREISSLWVEKAIEPIKRFLRADLRLRLMHREVRRVVIDDVFHGQVEQYRKRLDAWCASFVPEWPEAMPDYPIRHGVAHLADRARATVEPVERAGWTDLLAAAVGDRFIDLHERRVDRLRWLMTDLDDALDACTGDTTAGGHLRVIRTATVDARFRCGGLRPSLIFERARAGDTDGVVNRVAAIPVEEPWRQAALLASAWRVPAHAKGWADWQLRELSGSLAPGLDMLAARVAVDIRDGPDPATSLVDPPDEFRARSIVAQIGGGILGESGLAEPVVSGEQVGWEIERNRESLTRSLAGRPTLSPDEAPVYRAEVEGPLLVSFAAAQPEPGRELLRDYIALHAANPYTQYRNRSLWVLLRNVLHHPDGPFVSDLVEQLVAAALGVGDVVVADCIPLTAQAVLAARGSEQAPGAFVSRIVDLRKEAAGLTGVRDQGDAWSAHKRRLGCLAESAAVLGGDRQLAVDLLEQALALPFGYAGYQAPGCVTLAESALVCGAPGDMVDAALRAALTAAHNVQDPGFCARTTSRVNALTRRWWAPDVDAPTALHVVGEDYEHRDRQAGTVRLPDRVTGARTLTDLAGDVYDCSLTELERLNPQWPPEVVLPERTEVAVPDPDMAPLVAARLAAGALADPGLTGPERRLAIQQLAPRAVSNLTAVDTVLGRLLLAAADVADPVALAELAGAPPPASAPGVSAAFLA
jgi:hypothetical protein